MMEPSPQASASELPTWIEYGEPIAVIVAAVATVAAAVYAYFQYRAARQARRDALDAQKDAARAHEATEKARKEATWPYVVASPVPELTDEQHLALLFKNYGQTMAHDVRFTVVSEWVIVPPRRNDVLAGGRGQNEVPLPTTLLAPGQSFVETVLLTGGHEPGTLRSLVVRVEYKRPDGDAHIHEYEMTFGEADISGLQRPIVDALTGIEKTSARSSADRD